MEKVKVGEEAGLIDLLFDILSVLFDILIAGFIVRIFFRFLKNEIIRIVVTTMGIVIGAFFFWFLAYKASYLLGIYYYFYGIQKLFKKIKTNFIHIIPILKYFSYSAICLWFYLLLLQSYHIKRAILYKIYLFLGILGYILLFVNIPIFYKCVRKWHEIDPFESKILICVLIGSLYMYWRLLLMGCHLVYPGFPLK